MSGVMNHTARLLNLKTAVNGTRIVIRLVPGFNVVPTKDWEQFVPKRGECNKFVAELKEKHWISFGSKENEMELDQEPLSKTVVSKTAMNKNKKTKKDKDSEE